VLALAGLRTGKAVFVRFYSLGWKNPARHFTTFGGSVPSRAPCVMDPFRLAQKNEADRNLDFRLEESLGMALEGSHRWFHFPGRKSIYVCRRVYNRVLLF